MRPILTPSGRSRSVGFVLLTILVFILLLSMVALSLLFRAQGDETAGLAISGAEQAWAAAMSGIEVAMRVAAAAPVGSTDWWDDPSLFRAQAVYGDGADHWYFSVFSPADSESLAEFRYGLSDEASRLNLNHPGEADLSKIPGLTPTLADTLRQFLGVTPQTQKPSEEATLGRSEPVPVEPDLEPALEPPVQSAGNDAMQVPGATEVQPHGRLTTLDELLLVPGFSRALLHGGSTLPAESVVSSSTNASPELSATEGTIKRSRGLEEYFTVFSRDPNRSSTGQRRCDLNDPTDAWPVCDLPPSFSNYVAAVRASKTQFVHPSEALEATATVADAKGAEEKVASGITKENLATLLDFFTVNKDDTSEGLVNVNTASAAVLATIPGIDLPLAETIVSTRTGLSPERRTSTAWLYQEGLVDAAKFRAIAPSLTARSSQFHLHVVGYGLPSGRYRVLEAVIDLAGTEPQIIYLRDITRLGLPIRLKEENPAEPDELETPFQAAGPDFPHYPHG